MLRDRRFRGAVVVRVILIAVIAVYFAIPLLNTVTNSGFQDRFTDTHLTGRDKIIEADVMAFKENPIFGVGPGQSKEYHVRTFSRASTHTEYSRLIAEHGSFGLAALVLLGWMSFQRLLPTLAARGQGARRRVHGLGDAFHVPCRDADGGGVVRLRAGGGALDDRHSTAGVTRPADRVALPAAGSGT